MSVVVAGPGRVRERPFARTIVAKTVPSDPFDRLTAREREALRAVCTLGADGAASSLFLSLHTVKNHLTGAFRNLGLTGRTAGKIGQACFQLAKWEDRAR